MSNGTIYQFKIDDYERKVIINALHSLRNKLISESKTTDAIDDMLLKYIDAKPYKKGFYER